MLRQRFQTGQIPRQYGRLTHAVLQQILLESKQICIVQIKLQQTQAHIVHSKIAEAAVFREMNQTAAGIDCVDNEGLHQVPTLSQQEAAAGNSTTSQWRSGYMVEEHPLRLLGPAQIVVTKIIEWVVVILIHKNT